MLIGDIIVGARELYPDLPQVLPSVILISATPTNAISGQFVPPTTFSVVVTVTTLWGESAPSNELVVNLVAPNNSIQLQLQIGAGQRNYPIIAGVNVYVGSAGKETIGYFFPGKGPADVITLDGTVTGTYQSPPTRSTAFLPDTNGRFVSVGTLYRWLNEALNVASYICKGIPDVSGIQMTSGQGLYTMPGIWDKLENCWYDGYPVAFDGRGGAFYRNVLSGITFICILQTSADRQIVELQPQPSRSGGSTTLSAPVGINDTSIPLTSSAQVGLALGMIQVGTEIISYSTLTGGSATGCARGLGGTQQQAWIAGTVVKELNFRFGGLRLNQQVQYQPGQALVSLQVPPGWSPALIDYLVGRFREAEQNSQGKGESIKSFSSFLKDYLKGTKQVAGPRQIGGVGYGAGDGYPSASSGGRLIIP